MPLTLADLEKEFPAWELEQLLEEHGAEDLLWLLEYRRQEKEAAELAAGPYVPPAPSSRLDLLEDGTAFLVDTGEVFGGGGLPAPPTTADAPDAKPGLSAGLKKRRLKLPAAAPICAPDAQLREWCLRLELTSAAGKRHSNALKSLRSRRFVCRVPKGKVVISTKGATNWVEAGSSTREASWLASVRSERSAEWLEHCERFDAWREDVRQQREGRHLAPRPFTRWSPARKPPWYSQRLPWGHDPTIRIRKDAKSCDGGLAWWTDDCGHRRPQPLGCTKRGCTDPGCQLHVTAERARRARARLDCFGAEANWGICILPFARQLRTEARRPDFLSAMRRASATMLEKWLLGIHQLSNEWRLGIVCVDHPEGDLEPGEWKPHFNFLIPMVAVNRRTGHHAQLRYHVSQDALFALRNEWRRVQSNALGTPLKKASGLRLEANVKWEFRKGRDDEKKAHAMRYFFRTFPEWKAEAQRVRYFSLFGCGVVGELAGVQERLKELLEQSRAQAEEFASKRLCPDCGRKMRLELPDGIRPGWRPIHSSEPGG